MIARGITSMLRRLEHPGIAEVRTAFSGPEAISRIESWRPDVVIIDIRMPGTSGLEVIERCRTTDEGPLFFVLSGHDEFGYVKRAFKLGALDYLLKPASMDDLSELVRTATERTAVSSKEALADDVTARWSVQMEIERVLDSGDTTTISDALPDVDGLVPFRWFRMSVVRTPRSEPESALTMRKAVGPTIWDIGREHRARAYFFWTPDSDLGLLWNLDDRATLEPVQALWSAFPLPVREAPGSILAVSDAVTRQETLRELYARTASLLLYRFTPGTAALVTPAGVRQAYGVPTVRDVSEAAHAAQAGEVEAVARAADEVFADSPRGHGSALEDAYQALSDALTAYAERVGTALPRIMPIAELDTPRHVRTELHKAAEAAQSAVRESPAAADPVSFALEYVEAHLHEDLDMGQVASATGLSYSHFSRLFKERTGEGFAHYLLASRMKRARRMLDQSTMRVSEIAYAVGYANHKHFTRAFREYFGYTPTQYREGRT